MRYVINGLFFLALTAGTTFAQVGDLGLLMKGGVQDANVLLQAYMQPLGEGFSAAMNTGWINNARPHKFLGFDLKVGLTAVPIPVGSRNFTLSQNDLGTLTIVNPEIGSSPTFAGNNDVPPYTLAYFADVDPDGNGPIPVQRIEVDRFDMPAGVWDPSNADLQGVDPFIGAPMVQLGVGLFKKTDVVIRYVPEYDHDEYGSIGLKGIGIRHSISQWLPVVKNLKFIDVTAVGGYSVFDYTVPLNLPDPGTGAKITGQMIDWQTTAWNANVVAGITLSIPIIKRIIEPHIYVGYGIENGETTLDMLGRYGYEVPNLTTGAISTEYVENPLNMKFTSPNSNRLVLGARVKVISLLYVNAEYVQSEYSSYSVGVGITIR